MRVSLNLQFQTLDLLSEQLVLLHDLVVRLLLVLDLLLHLVHHLHHPLHLVHLLQVEHLLALQLLHARVVSVALGPDAVDLLFLKFRLFQKNVFFLFFVLVASFE